MENVRLRSMLDERLETDVLIADYEAKITTLSADRKNLLTTLEVLEADVKCLRAELRRAESRAKQRRSSVGDDILAELSMSEKICNQTSTSTVPPSNPGPSKQACSRVDHPATTPPAPSISTDTHIACHREFNTVLIVGDSHLRHSTKDCEMKGAFVECCPGGKIVDIKSVLLGYVGYGPTKSRLCLVIFYRTNAWLALGPGTRECLGQSGFGPN
ncbi:hypothetical protein J6590_060969 [Homalodisca vitripennis]|nr:hypothetical protein J6590_060969 [Homalodisca vitripennis]